MQVPAYLAETLFQNREQEPTTHRFRSPGNATPRSVPQKSHEQAPHSEDPREIIGDAQVSGQEGIVLV
jgi:hypothetical protein